MNAVTDVVSKAMNSLPARDIIQSPYATNDNKSNINQHIKPGDYAVVFIGEAEGPTLRGTAFSKSTMAEYHNTAQNPHRFS